VVADRADRRYRAVGAQQQDGVGIVNPSSFPRLHFAIAVSLTVLLSAFALDSMQTGEDADGTEQAAVLGASPALSEPKDREVAALLADMALPGPTGGRVAGALAALPELSAETAAEAATSEAAPAIPNTRSTTIQVRRGDNLSVIFKRQGIAAREIPALLAAEPLGKRLKKYLSRPRAHLRPGGRRHPDQTHVHAGAPRNAGVRARRQQIRVPRSGDRAGTRHRLQARRDRSQPVVASQRVGLSDALTMRLAQIFQWDIDFVLDIRKGDEFHVVYEELYVGDNFIGYGDILAAEFVNRGDAYRAIRYQDASGRADYFAPDGASMRKAFLRAPVEFSRISSNFNLRRIHPLFKRNVPHRGIDYAAPTGTPVLAAGDGRVATASRTEPNGNYVVLQHGEQFTTKYLHLSKFGRGIRSGAKVRQGQIIGYVGATGWATGPHLHYEFLVNGVHQNPRTVELPDAAPISAGELARFNQRTQPLLALLDDFKSQVQLAYGR
jgi:murein DD-endopeptidase MepM/ murein hydrolase activator NlpD